jgi:uncharacterized protein (TIGR03083 family)
LFARDGQTDFMLASADTIRSDYLSRVDALDMVWRRWAEIGEELSEQQWSQPTRCTGWDVAALYAHVGMFPPAVADPPAVPEDAPTSQVTAVEILRGFNASGGIAHTMAGQVAHDAVSRAASLPHATLVAYYADDGERAIAALRARQPTSLIAWPGVAEVTTWAQALRIVLMESVVHLLDVADALARAPEIDEAALHETSRFLTDLADPVQLIEAATGRSSTSPFPVLR